MEVNESSLGVSAEVVFLKKDGVTPAKVDGVPRWTLSEDPNGQPVGVLEVDATNPFKAKITPLPVQDVVLGPTHSATLRVEADGDLDADEERLVSAEAVFTVRRDEAQTAGITLTEIVPEPVPVPVPEPTPAPTPEPTPAPQP